MVRARAEAVLRRYEQQAIVANVARRFAMQFPSEAALKKYFEQHPKANPAKHSVKKKDDKPNKPEDPAAEDRKEAGDDLATVWKAGGDDPISTLIKTLRKGKAPTGKALQAAKDHAKALPEQKHETKALVAMLGEIPVPKAGKKPGAPKTKPAPSAEPKVEPSPKPDKQPEAADKPGHAKVTRTGVGRGSGKIELEGASQAKREALDKVVHKTKPTAEQIAGLKTSHVGEMLRMSGASAAHVEKVADWARAWVTGETNAKDPGAPAATSERLVTEFLDELGKPDSWARSQYEATQANIRSQTADLKARGVMDEQGYITLYRGISGRQAGEMRSAHKDVAKAHDVKAQVRGLSCWSEAPESALNFADKVILAQKVHHSRIVSMWSGQNNLWQSNYELEWTVLGADDGVAECQMHSEASLKKASAGYKAPTKAK